ncbi:hypothetical protein B7494_g8612 [Chlorociboria aeruginascens]|nr:hypothetical protein B7494_g8612 [Chlorociboria aeruginascens]
MPPLSILLIPGAFGTPEFYHPLTTAVTLHGLSIRALHLPSVLQNVDHLSAPPPTMHDDAAFIARETEQLADAGHHVLLIAHSYGGVPMTESVRGLEKTARLRQGKKGGVVRLAYMTALVVAVGTSAGEALADAPKENKLEFSIDANGWMQHANAAHAASIVFSDLPPDVGLAWARKFTYHSAATFGGELTYAGYKDVPVSYLVCENDRCILEKTQRAGIALVESVSGRGVDVTSIEAGHCPNESMPKKAVEWVLDIARKAGME